MKQVWGGLDFNADDQGNPAPIVGGRFDIVAHSMGGLVAQHFATLTGSTYDNAIAYSPALTEYTNVRNRSQGDFSTIVTIDTPHLLANSRIPPAEKFQTP